MASDTLRTTRDPLLVRMPTLIGGGSPPRDAHFMGRGQRLAGSFRRRWHSACHWTETTFGH